MSRLTLFNGNRPSAWFLGPALSALALFGLSHRDVLWPAVCALAILSSYITTFSLEWPVKGRRLRFLLGVVMAWIVAYLYFLMVLDGGRGLHYFPRFFLRPWFYTPGALLTAGLLACVWHTPFRPVEKGWAIYALSGWLIICSGQFYRPKPIIVAVILFYCVTVLLALVFAPPGHQAHGLMWRPARRQLAWLGCWMAVIGLGSWGVIRGLHRLEEDMARLIGELLRLPTYSGNLGANGTMKLRRNNRIRLKTTLVATIKSKQSPGYMRTRILTRYRKGMWSSKWRFGGWMPTKRVGQGYTHFVMNRRFANLPAGQKAKQKRLQVRTFLSLSGAVMVAYGTTEMTVLARARCRRSLEMTLDCRPLHLLHRYRLTRDPGERITRGAHPAAPGAMTLPIVDKGRLGSVSSRRPVPLPRPKATLRPTSQPIGAPLQTPASLPSLAVPSSVPARSSRASVGALFGGVHRRRASIIPGHLKRNTHRLVRPILKKLYPLAKKVAGRHREHPMRAAMLLQQYFRTNYRYSLDVKLARGGDPTLDFVLNKRPAYCQYFASGMALMMRSLGHRARVANGFAVKEFNTYAQRWLVRQLDAHAWTEVFDPQTQRWVAFDATAPGSLALLRSVDRSGRMSQLSAWMQVRWKELIAASRNVRFGEWLRSRSLDWLEALSKPANWAYLIGLIFLLWGVRHRGGVWAWLRQLWASLWGRRLPSPTRTLTPQSVHQQKVRGILEATLSSWAPFGIVLQPHETPEAYLQRLTALPEQNPEAPTPPISALQRFVSLYNELRFFPIPHGSVAVSSSGEKGKELAAREAQLQRDVEVFEQLAEECKP